MPDSKYTNDILNYATHGIDENIAVDEVVEVNLRDLMFVKSTLQEFVQFFHQPLHYSSLEDVEKYLGTRHNHGALHLLWKANYEKMEQMLPEAINTLCDNGAFDSPIKPYYFCDKNN